MPEETKQEEAKQQLQTTAQHYVKIGRGAGGWVSLEVISPNTSWAIAQFNRLDAAYGNRKQRDGANKKPDGVYSLSRIKAIKAAMARKKAGELTDDAFNETISLEEALANTEE